MGDIYIEVDDDFRVTKIHRMPFDPNNGMGYTREELEGKGYFVDEIPEPIHMTGRRSIPYYNPDTKSIYYECVGIPLSDKERMEYLENALNSVLTIVAGQDYAISTATFSYNLEDETDKEEFTKAEDIVDDIDRNIGIYLGYQVISGKIDIDECLRRFPQYESVIKETLVNNGIQP